MKHTTKKLGKIVAGVGLVGILAGLPFILKKIQPIGWGDVTGDGVADAMVLESPHPLDARSPFLTLGYIDGNRIEKDEHGDYRFKRWTRQITHQFFIPPLRNGEGVYRSTLIQRLGNNPGDAINLHLFTTVDVEPSANHQVYAAVKYQ